MLVFPTITAPCFFRRVTTCASYGGMYPLSIFDPHVVSMPFVEILSFTATGIPERSL